MKQLKQIIEDKTLNNTEEVFEHVSSMICSNDDFIPLHEDVLINALELNGEFLVLNAHYNDYDKELQEEKIKYKISQSLSVIVRYEDDGNSFEEIQKFVAYMHKLVDKKQNLNFGIKKVSKLSKNPITILFSGVLPINQLKMTLGKGLYALIHSDDEYFLPRFQQLRDDISEEIGIPILPLFPVLDKSLNDFEVQLLDLTDNRLISDVRIPIIPEKQGKEAIEIYLLKLFYIYITLAK